MIRVGANALLDPRMAQVWPASRDAAFDPIEFAARYFGCVEIDATEHVVPRREHVARWAGALADHPRTRLVVRIPASLARLDVDASAQRADATRFRDALAPILRRERLAAATLRLPNSWLYGARELRHLTGLARELRGAPLVLEAAHPSWYERTALDALRGAGWSLGHALGIDAWNAPPTRHAATGPVALLRLELCRSTSPAQVAEAAGRARELEHEVGTVLALVSAGTDRGASPALGLARAIELKYALVGQQPVVAWPELVAAFQHLEPLTRPRDAPPRP